MGVKQKKHCDSHRSALIYTNKLNINMANNATLFMLQYLVYINITKHKYYIQKIKIIMVLLSIIVSYLIITAVIKLLAKIQLDK